MISLNFWVFGILMFVMFFFGYLIAALMCGAHND